MKIKTKNCEDCKFVRWNGLEFNCKKKHKPKFYNPKNENDMDWGYKRKCLDYKSKSTSV